MPTTLKANAPVPCWQSARHSDLLPGKQGENRRGDARHLIGDDHERSVRQEAEVKVATSANKPPSETIAAAPGKQKDTNRIMPAATWKALAASAPRHVLPAWSRAPSTVRPLPAALRSPSVCAGACLLGPSKAREVTIMPP